ncbi:hypothetical protein APR50_17290 [Variovorax paradoxus]|jgi:hypothetical protein|uniref:hypothetical protein n=1 Tax=Variovorax paradoxus TaxID=34073 RepID=UPI0006E72215|nr:hypothetical protein APR52_32515 [Variovorax paradoxus]KPV06291.1 hypothetical protein APR50_17290 [Variovorax paradoxus]KPV06720.1 hypothetical protein APR49_19025 [Variovorax paradoxus]KPV20825.1 hypothetical protein APR51_16020 [Variovorax paradoxus]KPV32232.1 hypothetical protein APR48_14070 [Variovorax paradoxus]
MSADLKKPAKLQVNTSGAWKDVVRFDATDVAETDRVTDAADELGQVGAGAITFRLVSDEALPRVLFRWTHPVGWKAVEHG